MKMQFNTDNKLQPGQLYPCCDRPRGHEGTLPTTRIAAVWSGQKRPPRKGEWYISGAIPEAYRAPNDLSDVHAIAFLVTTEKVTEYTVTPLTGDNL